jgi:hypothetical protein
LLICDIWWENILRDMRALLIAKQKEDEDLVEERACCV